MIQDTYNETNSRCASTTPTVECVCPSPKFNYKYRDCALFSKLFIIRLNNRKYILSHISYKFSEIFKVGLFVVSIHPHLETRHILPMCQLWLGLQLLNYSNIWLCRTLLSPCTHMILWIHPLLNPCSSNGYFCNALCFPKLFPSFFGNSWADINSTPSLPPHAEGVNSLSQSSTPV